MEKNIFEYWNGETKVFGDPLVIIREFKRACNWDDKSLFELTQSKNDQQADDASSKIIAAARIALNMPPVDPATGLGATEEVVFSEFDRFQQWWAKKKATTESKPMSEPPSDQWEAIKNYVASGQTYQG